jgi:hypothetical protein
MAINGFYIPPEPAYGLFAVLTRSVILSPVGLTVQLRAVQAAVTQSGGLYGPRHGGGGEVPMQYERDHVYAFWQFYSYVHSFM